MDKEGKLAGIPALYLKQHKKASKVLSLLPCAALSRKGFNPLFQTGEQALTGWASISLWIRAPVITVSPNDPQPLFSA